MHMKFLGGEIFGSPNQPKRRFCMVEAGTKLPPVQTENPSNFQKEDEMNDYANITALYERLSIGDERQRRDGEDSNSIQSQKMQLEQYAKQHGFPNIKHYTDDDESGRFFDRTGYSRMIEGVESGKIGIVIMKDLTRYPSNFRGRSPSYYLVQIS